jgi:hypothetical protein
VEVIANQQLSAAETERTMKVQEVILKAMAGTLKWTDAAEIIGISDRSLRRWRERYQQHGYNGLYDYRKKRPSPNRIPMATAKKVLELYREKYFDFRADGHFFQLRVFHFFESPRVKIREHRRHPAARAVLGRAASKLRVAADASAGFGTENRA